jgi:hypothetical protein
MELDRLSVDEYRKRQAGGLCFKCGKKGIAWDCLNHERRMGQRSPFQRNQGCVAAIEAPLDNNTDMNAVGLVATETPNTTHSHMTSPSMQSVNLTKEPSDFLLG